MEIQQATEILIQVAQMAQAKGVLSLQDAAITLQAIQVLTPKKEEDNVEEN
jgi:hypothetical protein